MPLQTSLFSASLFDYPIENKTYKERKFNFIIKISRKQGLKILIKIPSFDHTYKVALLCCYPW